MTFWGSGQGDAAVGRFVRAVCYYLALTTLYLLRVPGKRIVGVLPELMAFQSLLLTGWELSAVGSAALAAALPPALQRLSLDRHRLGREDVRAFFSVMWTLLQLRELVLVPSEEEVTRAFAKNLLQTLRDARGLRHRLGSRTLGFWKGQPVVSPTDAGLGVLVLGCAAGAVQRLQSD